MQKKAVILVSGGLDSSTCLAVAKAEGYECYVMSFDYGQRNRAELAAATRLAKFYDAPLHKIIKLNLQEIGGSALTDNSIPVPDYKGDDKIPVTYVPARNTVFLSIALGWAEVLAAQTIFIGASSVDYSGYPDCRPEYFNAFSQLAALATKAGVQGNPVQIKAPLLHLTKAQTIQLGVSLGVNYALTVTCYRADEHGAACNTCDSCTLRRKGFEQAGIHDPTVYTQNSFTCA